MSEEVKTEVEAQAEVKPVTQPGNKPPRKPPAPPKVVVSDEPIEPEKPHASVPETNPERLPANVLAEQAAGRAALARRK